MKKLIIDFKNPTILLQNKFCFHDYYIIYFEFNSINKTLKIKVQDLDNQKRFATNKNKYAYKSLYEINLLNVSKIENKHEGNNGSFFEKPNLLAELTFDSFPNKRIKLNFTLNGIIMHHFQIIGDKAEINIF